MEQEEPQTPYIKEEEDAPQPPHIKDEEEEHRIRRKGERLEVLEEFPVIEYHQFIEEEEELWITEERVSSRAGGE
ncbi:uncharacterized protein [Nerophis lumbriciformis]|uniref:uncharacterized protein isoform X3 n=1 Tax=Nerophis lumbriciformis TaxID=546530 RepID=UPI003BA8A508